MSPQYSHRQPQGFSRAVVWLGSTSLALIVGCVDSPEPATSNTPAAPVAVAPVVPELTEPTIAELTPVAVDALDPQDWGAASTSSPDSQPEPALASDRSVGEPTPAEPTLAKPTTVALTTAPSLIPGGLNSTVPTSEPASTVPTPLPATAEPLPVANIPSSAPAQPASNPNSKPLDPKPLDPKPLEAARPKGLILISPRHKTPLATPPVAATSPPQPASSSPAVILPPSPSADAALLSPLKAGPTPAKVIDKSLASLDPKVMSPSLPTPPVTKPHPLASSTGTPVSPISISQPIAEPPTGFTALFNNKDLTGWEVYDGKWESWQFKDGEVSCVAPGGGWLQSLEHYCDFELRFEYRLSAGGNSGVCLRFPGQGNPSLEGLEIQLLDDRADKYKSIQAQQATGSLYFVTAPKIRDVARAAGEWNQCTLRCVGDQLQVTINDQLVNEIDLGQLASKTTDPAKRPVRVRSPMGSVALQSHSTRVDFRNVHIQDLTQALASGVRWLDLQPGTGDPVPAGATVTVHYIGFLSTGKRFANSFEKGKPATVPLKDVIPGWREGIPGMKVGGKRRLIVPANMAYGAKGFKEVVPPNATLVYEIELTGFEKPAESPTPASGNTPATADTGNTEVK